MLLSDCSVVRLAEMILKLSVLLYSRLRAEVPLGLPGRRRTGLRFAHRVSSTHADAL